MGNKFQSSLSGTDFDLYISNYPSTAQYLAHRLKDPNKTIMELCCGIGVSLLEFAPFFKKVIGVDNDSDVLKFCEENISQSKYKRKIQIKRFDVTQNPIFIEEKIDIMIYDIPYWFDHRNRFHTLHTPQDNPNLEKIISNLKNQSLHDIVIYTPPYFSEEDAHNLHLECEYEKVYLNGKHDRNHIYLGNLIQKIGTTRINLNF